MSEEFEDSRQVSNDSYTTLSEHSTTDTSIHESPTYLPSCNCVGVEIDSSEYVTDSETNESTSDENDSDQSSDEDDNYEGYLTVPGTVTDSDDDWDVTDSSMDVPEDTRGNRSPLLRLFDSVGAFVSPRRNRRSRMTEEEQMMRAQALSEEEQIKFLRDQAFRERSWSLEECSICFDVILKTQEVMSLPCTHHFHTACILPWLQEQQTCPNCRKAAE